MISVRNARNDSLVDIKRMSVYNLILKSTCCCSFETADNVSIVLVSKKYNKYAFKSLTGNIDISITILSN